MYRKPTNSESYIHYFSYHGPEVKKSILVTFFLRAYRLCDMCTMADEINHIFCTFIELKYPLWFIDDCHQKARYIFYNPKETKKKEYHNAIVLPYSSSLNNIKKLKCSNKLHITYKYNNTIKNSLSKFKPLKDMGGVYSIPCKNCNNTYFGETGRDLPRRLYEHRGDIRRGNDLSSIFNHVLQGHSIDFDNSKFVFNSDNYINRRIVESILIKKYPNFNISEGQFQIGEVPLEIISKRLLSRIKIP